MPQRPGCARPLESLHVTSGEGWKGDVKAFQRSALSQDHVKHRSELVGSAIGGEQPVQPGGAPERSRPARAGSRAPQRWAGLLERTRQKRDPVGPVVGALVADLFAGPQGKDESQGLIKFRGKDVVIRVFA